MILKLKIPAICLIFIIPFFLFCNGVNAQSPELNKSYADARAYYYNGQYQYVYQVLTPNVSDIQGTNKPYYQGNSEGRGMVFRVYKMIIESEYAMNQIERAEWFEDWVINYFMGIFSPEQVYDYLEYAQL